MRSLLIIRFCLTMTYCLYRGIRQEFRLSISVILLILFCLVHLIPFRDLSAGLMATGECTPCSAWTESCLATSMGGCLLSMQVPLSLNPQLLLCSESVWVDWALVI